jgi:hypothetical protein
MDWPLLVIYLIVPPIYICISFHELSQGVNILETSGREINDAELECNTSGRDSFRRCLVLSVLIQHSEFNTAAKVIRHVVLNRQGVPVNS